MTDVTDVTGPDGRFFVSNTDNPDARHYEAFPWDDRRPDVYVHNRDVEPDVILDQGEQREIVVQVMRIPQ